MAMPFANEKGGVSEILFHLDLAIDGFRHQD